jgi:hypothetical protein
MIKYGHMNLLVKLFSLEGRFKRKSLEQIEVEADAEYGKEQFQKLAKRGIRIPIALL